MIDFDLFVILFVFGEDAIDDVNFSLASCWNGRLDEVDIDDEEEALGLLDAAADLNF